MAKVKKSAKRPVKKAPKKGVNKSVKKPTKSAKAKKKPAPPRTPKKPVAKKSPAKKPVIPSANAAGNAGATTSGSAWHQRLRDELEKLPEDFVAFCRDVGAKATDSWVHADTDEVRGLEAWGREITTRDRALGTAALCAVAQTGFPLAMAAAGGGADNMGFHAREEHHDGAPVETQIANAAAWLADPSKATADAVAAGFDPTRQLNVWEDDLIAGTEDQPWFWYSEVGQCLACAIARGDGGDDSGDTYEDWTAPQIIGRGLVMATRGLREGGSDVAALETLRAGIA